MNAVRSRRLGGGLVPFSCLIYLMICFFPFLAVAQSGNEEGNRVVSLSVDDNRGTPLVQLKSESPIGYRYTVYDSYDPMRVVVDLPGTDLSSLKGHIKGSYQPIQEIRTNTFELASGKLGRIELLLTREAKYKVISEGSFFSISFDQAPENNLSGDVENKLTDGATGSADKLPTKILPLEKETDSVVQTAKTIKSIQIGPRKVRVISKGDYENYQYFHLRTPSRLVVDLYGIKPEFNERVFKLAEGFTQIRVGVAEDKTRLVLDADGSGLPPYKITKQEKELIIAWDESIRSLDPKKTESTETVKKSDPEPANENVTVKEKDAEKAPVEKEAEPHTGMANPQPDAATPAISGIKKNAVLPKAIKPLADSSVSVEGVDFTVKDGKSILTVSLSAPGQVTGPTVDKNLVRFGIKGATISRQLRRAIDISSFPSSVKRIIPYVVAGGGEVRFLAELKEDTPFSLQQENKKLLFVVDNAGFAEPAPETEKVSIPLPEPVMVGASPAGPSSAASGAISLSPTVVSPATEADLDIKNATAVIESASSAATKKQFSGEKISLVFDDANIRNILQLIGEVSDLNIIAGEDVKGTITLRLIDVPWDQALNLILESKGLGMLREGNVVRIMPREQIRSLRQAEMTAVKEEKQLEQVVTEVIPINYTALGNITTPAKELLTDRGKITEDARNKQIIVTDIPSSIEGIKKLAAILDTPERQVMIEARIVEANSSFGRDLGVKWGLSYKNNNGGPGDINNANIGLGGSFLIAPPAAGSVMGNAGMGSGITFGRIGIDSTVLDLRISALESAGYGKVISTPRVSTLNGGTASISQGTKIPYQSSGDDGKAKTEFVDANLSLTVQPIINPDDSIILDISATNSSIGSTVSTGAGTAPAIDTKEAKTKVIVRNGETTVIGGIFVETENSSQAGVPFLMKIPIIGHLFRSDNKTNTRSELLVFITPRIVQ